MQVNLVFVKKDGTLQSFKLPSDVTFIGRRQDCDLCIPLSMVSRRHCEIYTDQGNLMVRDLHSRNGISVNGQSVEEARIKAGDVLKIGPIMFIFQIDGVPANFDEYLPRQKEKVPPPAAPARQDRSSEAEFEEVMEGLPNGIAGQSQTMDLGDVLSEDIFADNGFDLDSDLPNA
ncbi:MAG: FHA domain-containing protein [Planctomycetales bacterium]|nr:FHA domain-containing protein [Planctomycetales bacterium]